MVVKNYSDEIILVDLPAEPDVRRELNKVMELIRAGSGFDLIIDFSGVDILRSLSLSGFLQLNELLSKTGHRMIFCNISQVTRDIFRTTCFENIFKFADSIQSAASELSAVRA